MLSDYTTLHTINKSNQPHTEALFISIKAFWDLNIKQKIYPWLLIQLNFELNMLCISKIRF